MAPALQQSKRVDALDALRGFAILTMLLSGMVPRGALPAWMYHAQIPPPDHRFNPSLAGLTWVDLVFPLFLFAMGASMPFALTRRLAAAGSRLRVLGQIILRGLLLVAFAVYITHVDPWRMAGDSTPTFGTWMIALLAFVLMFPALARLPRSWPKSRVFAVRAAGWGGAVMLVVLTGYVGQDRLTSDWRTLDGALANINRIAERSDIIIVVLANTAVLGSLAWWATRGQPALRIAVMIALLGTRLAHDEPGWIKTLWDFQPIPRLFRLYFAQYLLIVLPGTIAGDVLYAWQQAHRPHEGDGSGSRDGEMWFAAVCGALVAFTLCGLQGRWLPWSTPAGVAVLLSAGFVILRKCSSPRGNLLRRLFCWGAVWLLVGLIFEPYEGGIKKDHPTVSYYFVTSGLACFALCFFTLIIDGLRLRRGFDLLIANGRNPMIAYLGIRNLLPPMLALTGIDALLTRITPTPWLGVLRAIAKTILLAYCVKWFSRKRIYWRT